MASPSKAAPAKLTLDELAGQFSALDALLIEAEGEVTAELEAWLLEYDLAQKDKVDGYALYVKELEGRMAYLKEREIELAGKRRTIERRIDWLKRHLQNYLELRGLTRLEGSIYHARLQTNGGKLPLVLATEDPNAYPEECRVTTVGLNKEAIRALVTQDAIDPDLAHLGTAGVSLRFG